MQKILLALLHVLLCLTVDCSLSLLGIKSGSGSTSGGHPPSPEAPVTFRVDTSDPSLTTFQGKALQLKLDSLEIASLDGLLRLSSSHAHFEKDGSIWKTTVEQNSIGHYHNNRKLMFIDVSSHEIKESKLNFLGDAIFNDVFVTEVGKQRGILTNLCKADRTITPLPLGVTDPATNEAAVQRCETDMADTQLSLAAMHDYSSKLLLSSTVRAQESAAALSQLRTQVDSLSAAMVSGAVVDPATEKERVRAIMTEFEAVVDALRLELTGRVKSVKSSFDELQQLWGGMDDKLSGLDANMTARLDHALSPMKAQLSDLEGSCAEGVAAVNLTLHDALAESRAEIEAKVQSALTATELVAGGLVVLNSTASRLGEAFDATAEEVRLNLQALDARLNSSLAGAAEAWETALNASRDDLSAQLHLLTANGSASWEALLRVQEEAAAQQGALQNVTSSVLELLSDRNILSADLASLRENSQLQVNESIVALHEEVMAEFSHSHRESQAALDVLNATLTEGLRQVNVSAAERVAAIEGSLEAAQEANRILFEAHVATVSAEAANATEHLQQQHAQLLDAMDSSVLQLRAEIVNSTLAYHNISTAAIAELTANTSQVVARSNSILARAIGEVNNTLLSVNTSLLTRIGEERADVEAVLRRVMDEYAQLNDAAHTELAAVSSLSLQRTEATLIQSLTEVNSSATTQLAAVNASLRGELSALVERWESDAAATRNTSAAASLSVWNSLQALDASANERHSLLNASIAQGLTVLATQLARAESELTASAATQTTALTTAFHSNLSAAEQRWATDLVGVSSNMSAALTHETDKLRYSLSGLNNTLFTTRAEGRAALEAALAVQTQAVEAAKQNISAALTQVRTEFAATSSALTSKINASDLLLKTTRTDQAAALTNASATLTAALAAAEQRANTSAALVASEVLRLNLTLSAELLKLRDDGRASASENTLLAQRALEKESQRLQTAIEGSSQTVLLATNHSLNGAVEALRATINSTVQMVKDSSLAESARLSAALAAVAAETKAQQQNTSAALTKLGLDVHANITAVEATAAGRAVEHSKALTALNASVSASRAEAASAVLSAVTDLRAILANTNATAIAATAAVNARIDSAETGVQRLNVSATAGLAFLGQQLNIVNATTGAALSAQWIETESLASEIRIQTLKNISSLNRSLSDALESYKAVSEAAVMQASSSLSSQVEAVRAETVRQVKSVDEGLATVTSALNASISAEARARESADAASAAELQAHISRYSAHVSGTDTQLAAHSAAISAQAETTAMQQAALNASLSNLTAQQADYAAQLLQQVDARVREAELQQRLGTVAVEGVSNETNRLFQAVAASTSRVAAMEVSVATTAGDLLRLQQQLDHARAFQSNLSTAVLPEVFSKLGALQQATTELAADTKRRAAEISDFREAATRSDQKLKSGLGAVESRVSGLAQDLKSSQGEVALSVAQLQQQFIATAVAANATAEKAQALSASLAAEARAGAALGVEVTETGRRLLTQEQQLFTVATALEASKLASEAAAKAHRDAEEASARQVRELEAALARQQLEIRALQEDNRRLVRESATAESVDELRKLLFELQGQMLGHSGKVLDLLLQPRSAVLVNPPVPCCAPPPQQPDDADSDEVGPQSPP